MLTVSHNGKIEAWKNILLMFIKRALLFFQMPGTKKWPKKSEQIF